MLGVRPNNNISIEFEIRSKFGVLWFEMYLTDHNDILHMSQQCYCRDMCTLSLWSAACVIDKSIAKFHWISNSIKISLVGRGPAQRCYM